MFCYHRDKNVMGEWPGLAKPLIRVNHDVLFGYSAIEYDLRSSLSRGPWVMAEKCARDAQQVALHV
jgi:hypothetical protein